MLGNTSPVSATKSLDDGQTECWGSTRIPRDQSHLFFTSDIWVTLNRIFVLFCFPCYKEGHSYHCLPIISFSSCRKSSKLKIEISITTVNPMKNTTPTCVAIFQRAHITNVAAGNAAILTIHGRAGGAVLGS